jgi:hypothetical protein
MTTSPVVLTQACKYVGRLLADDGPGAPLLLVLPHLVLLVFRLVLAEKDEPALLHLYNQNLVFSSSLILSS